MRNWGRVLGKLEIMYPTDRLTVGENLTNYGIYFNTVKN